MTGTISAPPIAPMLSDLARSLLEQVQDDVADRPFEMRSGADVLIERYGTSVKDPDERDRLQNGFDQIVDYLVRWGGSEAGPIRQHPLRIAGMLSFAAVELGLAVKARPLLNLVVSHMESGEEYAGKTNDARLVLRAVGRLDPKPEMQLVWATLTRHKDLGIRTLAYQSLVLIDVDSVLAALHVVDAAGVNRGLVAHRILRACGSAEAVRDRLESSLAAWEHRMLLAEMLVETGELSAAAVVQQAQPVYRLVDSAVSIMNLVRDRQPTRARPLARRSIGPAQNVTSVPRIDVEVNSLVMV
ncbi:hypothetical protein [Aureimonas phyllosphaerae]|uniref:Uncharacterized protein n=1 Tax=Aureimonas phyllosphaerae TaxID=1166078 RepID=A0A7W6C2F2_9HYPH|nr:hypothetical protein [Aureimonas phyllosphaerae]MBB3937242.1 hypothetical protein [Aureimonas phyllosphaerae]MBB3961121.1 hypothetical protein [Aureimonas phyllosphaerae]SFF49309.1 hypothetical protein SAMN05216566_11770 [Aureimonas phyllosphaerae]